MRDQEAPVIGNMAIEAWIYLGIEEFWEDAYDLKPIPTCKTLGNNFFEVTWQKYHYSRPSRNSAYDFDDEIPWNM